jgi:hypothetical protein
MNRTARAAVVLPLVALVASGLVAIACRGGGTLDGIDASFDGEATGRSPGSATARDGACAQAILTIDDNAASENASSGGPGCTSDNECTVRMEGDYCACPSTPRPMLTSRATAFDDSRNGLHEQCTCPIPPCEPPLPSKAGCRDGRCVLVDAGE